jgi:uncharacterized protein YbaR (Trm112 family)
MYCGRLPMCKATLTHSKRESKKTSYRAAAHIDGAPFSKREAWEGMRTELISRKNDLLFQIKDLLREDEQ